MLTKLLIKNARLDAGYETDSLGVVHTLTEKKDILIEEGKITQINDSIEANDVEMLNADGKLLLPSLREMHIHIDKTYFGGPWKAPKLPTKSSVAFRIEEELELLPKQLPYAEDRARYFVEHLIKNGHTHIRTHCNVDPGIQLKHMENTLKVLEDYKNDISYEIVAFPQHGLLRSGVEGLIREAMKMGATLVGGVDPATIDRNIDRSLETTFDIAVEANAGIDIHLHDPDTLGIFQMEKIVKLIKETKLQNKVTISHAMSLGHIKADKVLLKDTAQMLAEVGIDITSTIPMNSGTIPVLELLEYGVPVSVGHDSLMDHWSPFGTGDTIEKLSIFADRFRLVDEKSLSNAWRLGSGGIRTLNENGEQQWPKVGDEGNVLLVDTSCSAETVARRKPITHTIYQGRIISSLTN